MQTNPNCRFVNTLSMSKKESFENGINEVRNSKVPQESSFISYDQRNGLSSERNQLCQTSNAIIDSSQSWICSTCSFNNDKGIARCIICGNSKSTQSQSTMNTSPSLESEPFVSKSNIDCTSVELSSMKKDEELKIETDRRKMSEMSRELLDHSNDNTEIVGNGKLEFDSTSNLFRDSSLCRESYIGNEPNDEGTKNCVGCQNIGNIPKPSMIDVINNKLEDEKTELKGKKVSGIKDEEGARHLQTVSSTNKTFWECKICMCICVQSTINCEACLALRDSSIVECDFFDNDPLQAIENWRCAKCNSFNGIDVFKCCRCFSLAHFYDKWKCEQCTFYNETLMNRCEACYKNNPHLCKCAKCRKIVINNQFGDEFCTKCLNDRKAKEIEKRNLFQSNHLKMNENEKEGAAGVKLEDGKSLPLLIRDGMLETKGSEMTRECKNCQKRLEQHEMFCCQQCEQYRWYCLNDLCSRINFLNNAYCEKCHIKRDTDLSKEKSFSKWINNREIVLYRCGICLKFNDDQREECVYCQTRRATPTQYGKGKVGTVCVFGDNILMRNKFFRRLFFAGYLLYYRFKNLQKRDRK